MSSLDALMIQGIRSFGAGSQDQGMIKFLSPLTLILGENGCGKTTIIEALKYATTGDMPPGSSRGQSFVHDPSMSGEVTVRAQTKLLFTNVRGEKMVAQRIFEGTQKKTNISVKRLDSTLSRTTASGETDTVSKKCVDMEAEMFLALGVTKPILNYVIFCHQEESNWPLDEGKKLKERFDAIFDATEYLKCIKNMKEHVKSLRQKASEKKAYSEVARKDCDEAKYLKADISTQETRLSVSVDKTARCDKDLEEVVAELRKLQKIEDQMAEIVRERTQQETRLGELKKSVCSLEESLCRPQCLQVNDDVTPSQLDSMMEEMVASVEQQRRDSERDQARLIEVQRRSSEAAEKCSRLSVKQGSLETSEETLRKRRQERDSMIAKLYSLHDRPNVVVAGQQLSEQEASAATLFMQEIHGKAKAEQQRVGEEVTQAVEAAQIKLDAARDEKTKLESQVGYKHKQLSENATEASAIQERLEVARGSSSKLKELDGQLKKLEAKTASLKESLNEESVAAQLKKTEGEVTALESEARALEVEKDAVLAAMSLKNELAVHQESIHKKEGEVKRLLNKNAEALATLDMSLVERDRLSSHLENKCRSLLTAANKRDAELKRSQKAVNAAEVSVCHLQSQVAELERTLTKEQAELSAALAGTDLAAELERVSLQEGELQEQHGQLAAMKLLNNRYIERLERQDAPCPLCHRDFETADEAAELVAELRNKSDGLPRELAESEERVRGVRERHADLLTLRPKQERLTGLRETELPALRTQLEQAQTQLTSAQQSHAHLQKQAAEADQLRRLAENLRSDVGRIDDRERDLRRARADADRLKARLPDQLSERSPDQVSAELEQRRASLEAARDRHRSDDARLRHHRDQLQKLGAEQQRLAAEQLRLQQLQAERSQLEQRRAELQRTSEEVRAGLTRLEESAGQLEEACAAAVATRDQTASEGRQREERLRGRVEAVREEMSRLQTVVEAVRTLQRQNTAQDLLSVRQQLRDLADQKSECSAEEARLRVNIDRLLELLRSKELQHRDLRDHKQLRQLRDEQQKLVEAVAALDDRLQGFNSQSVRDRRRQLERDHRRLTEARASETGAQRQIQDVLRERRQKLAKPQFSQAETEYRDRCVELVCHNLVIRDLQKYAKALDDAILRFHSKRMQRINMIIRELWRSTYSGNDIDHIEIETEQCSEGAGQKRTTYNYRVVMVKRHSRLDMRGRCSAGQKVLASLIIRLALAETFGVQCGVLALDEPTTNLDQHNIQSLAVALEEIVRKRAVQKNFQLVVITHDEEFLRVLTRLDYADKYYMLSRNSQGLSRVQKCDTSTL